MLKRVRIMFLKITKQIKKYYIWYKAPTMKSLKYLFALISLLCLGAPQGFSQAQLSTVDWYEQPFPSVVNWGDIVHFDLLIENTGDSIYYGPLSLNLIIENDSGQWETEIYTPYDSLNPIAIFPGDQIAILGNDSVDQLRYQAGDNTIVVWPSSLAPTVDSLYANTFVLDPDGVAEEPKMDIIQISNPVKDKIVFHRLGDAAEVKYNRFEIYDLNGKLILSEIRNQFLEIDVQNLNNGLYFMIIYEDQEVVSKSKFIKE